jgi:hypothetical protein
MRRLLILAGIAAFCPAALLAAGLTFSSPKEWKSTPTTSSMRVAQFVLPKSAGDAQDAELVIYYFGGDGGTVDANIERWVGQIQQADGKPSKGVAKRTKRTVNGLALTLVDVTGTYTAEMSPGSGDRRNSSNFRLRAGVVETANGPYFVKLTGPAKTVAAWDVTFEQFISSFKYQP